MEKNAEILDTLSRKMDIMERIINDLADFGHKYTKKDILVSCKKLKDILNNKI